MTRERPDTATIPHILFALFAGGRVEPREEIK